MTKELTKLQQSELLNFCNHFAERLQDALDAGEHPWGSGSAMSGVLNEYDDWHKNVIDGQDITDNVRAAREAIINQEVKEAQESCDENNDYESGDIYDNGYNDGFLAGLEHVQRMMKEGKI